MKKSRLTAKERQDLLIDNFIGLQSAMTNLSVKFEDLVHPERKGREYARLVGFLMPDLPEEKAFAFSRQMETAASRLKTKTFRKGIPGDWKKHFTQEHTELFRRYAGDLLAHLGYE